LTIRRGAPSRRRIEVAATGSVGPTIAPRAKAGAQPKAEDAVGDDRDRRRRRQHETDREQRDHPQVAPQRRQVGEEGARVQQRG
jgi:hypothetical protein